MTQRYVSHIGQDGDALAYALMSKAGKQLAAEAERLATEADPTPQAGLAGSGRGCLNAVLTP